MILLNNVQAEALEINLAKETGEILHAAYPGNLWQVTVEGPRVMVRNLALAGRWGYVRYIPSIYSASDWKRQTIKDGGELMERFNLSRKPKSLLDTLLEAFHLPTDRAGNHIASV
jgi:hypothetical protein